MDTLSLHTRTPVLITTHYRARTLVEAAVFCNDCSRFIPLRPLERCSSPVCMHALVPSKRP